MAAFVDEWPEDIGFLQNDVKNRNIINDRHSTLKSGEIIELSRTEYNEVQNYLTYNCEDFVFD